MELNGTTDEHLITCLPECLMLVLLFNRKKKIEGKGKKHEQ
jgi:hypothetical protein